MEPEELEARDVAGKWFDCLTDKQRRGAFIDLVSCMEMDVVRHISNLVKRSLELDEKIKKLGDKVK